MIGPDQWTPHLRPACVIGQEQRLPERVRHPGGHGAGDQQTDHDVADHGCPLHDEDVADRRQTSVAEQTLREAPLTLDRHVHGGVALHRPGHALERLLAGCVDQLRTDEEPEEQRHQDDDDRAAHELRERELPAEQQRQDDAQLDDQVGARDLEDDGRDEARALAEQRARHRHRGVRAGRAGDAQPGGLGERRRPIVTQHPRDGLAAYDGLDDGRQGEPEDQRPGDLPGHRPGHREGVAERREGGRDRLAPFSMGVESQQQTGEATQHPARPVGCRPGARA